MYPLVSVIIPTKDRPDFLKFALQSVLSQTFPHFEIIVVNDGGKDVREVIDSFKDARLIYLQHEHNQGPSSARNTAIHAAKGTYIAYLDDDDLYYPDHLQTLVEALQKNDYKIAHTNYYEVHKTWKNETFHIYKKKLCKSVLKWPEIIAIQNSECPPNTLMHQRSLFDTVGLFDETLMRHEDWDFLIRAGQKTPFLHVPKVTVEYTHLKTTAFNQTHAVWKAPFLHTMQILHARYHDLALQHDLLPLQKEERDKMASFVIQELENMPSEERKKLNPDTLLRDIFESCLIFGKEGLQRTRFLITTVLRYFPDHAALWLLEARTSRLLGDAFQARLAIRRAFEQDKSPEILEELVAILEASGLHEAAENARKGSYESAAAALFPLLMKSVKEFLQGTHLSKKFSAKSDVCYSFVRIAEALSRRSPFVGDDRRKGAEDDVAEVASKLGNGLLILTPDCGRAADDEHRLRPGSRCDRGKGLPTLRRDVAAHSGLLPVQTPYRLDRCLTAFECLLPRSPGPSARGWAANRRSSKVATSQVSRCSSL